MEEKEIQEAVDKMATRRVKEVPEDVEFATLEDFDEIDSGYTIVPIRGKGGKILNCLTRSITAGERRIISKTAFPKSVKNTQGNPRRRGKRNRQVEFSDDDMVKFMEASYQQDCLTIKTGTVFPEELTLERIRKLPAEDFDRLLDSINKEDDLDAVDEFPEEDES